MAGSLEGYAILVTRPEEQAAGLIAAIEKQGGQVIFAPMIAIRGIADDVATKKIVDRLRDYSVAVFISRNAVEFGVEWIKACKQTLDHCAVYAVGVGTGARLRELGIRDVHTPKGEFSSEGLLKMPGLSAHEIEGKRVVIIRGAGGREQLAHTLQSRGAEVDYCEVYERVVPKTNLSKVLRAHAITAPDIIVITSLEILTNLAEKIDQEHLDILYDVPLLVAGSRTAQEVERLGFTTAPIIVDNPGDASIVEALIRWVEDAP